MVLDPTRSLYPGGKEKYRTVGNYQDVSLMVILRLNNRNAKGEPRDLSKAVDASNTRELR